MASSRLARPLPGRPGVPPRSLVRSLGAVLGVLAASGLLHTTRANGVASVLLLFTVVLGASMGGRAPGISAAIASGIVLNVWVQDPRGQLLTAGEDLGAVVAFVALGITVGTLVQRFEDAGRRSEQREQEAARIRLDAELARSRAMFFAAAGHNLRIPLASLVAAVSVLAEPDGPLAPQDRAEMINTTRTELDGLVRLVDKVLAMSQINAEHFEARRTPVDLEGLAQAAVKRFDLLAREHHFHLDVPAELGQISLDVVMVEQLLLNLLENAVQAAPPGTEIAVVARADGDVLVLDVVDHGPGVAPDERLRIFGEGERGATSDARGSGLGLAIVAAVTAAHGGTVRCLPTPGGGATMSVRFPGTLQPCSTTGDRAPGRPTAVLR